MIHIQNICVHDLDIYYRMVKLFCSKILPSSPNFRFYWLLCEDATEIYFVYILFLLSKQGSCVTEIPFHFFVLFLFYRKFPLHNYMQSLPV